MTNKYTVKVVNATKENETGCRASLGDFYDTQH